MTAEVLTQDGLTALEGTPLGPAIPWLRATSSAVVIVRDDEQAIVGHWALTALWHAEAAWVMPAHQKRGVVLRHLLEGMAGLVHAHGGSTVLCQTDSPAVERMLVKLAASVMPGRIWYVPMGGE